MKSLLVVLALMTVTSSAFAEIQVSIGIGGSTYQGRGDNYDRCHDRSGRPARCLRPPRPGYPGPGYPGPGYPPPPSYGGDVQLLRCESNDRRYSECYFDSFRVRSVTLVRQHSDAACIPGRTFGIQRNTIWVDQGCRATFEIIRR